MLTVLPALVANKRGIRRSFAHFLNAGLSKN